VARRAEDPTALDRRALIKGAAGCACCGGLLGGRAFAQPAGVPQNFGGCTAMPADARLVLGRRIAASNLSRGERRFAAAAGSAASGGAPGKSAPGTSDREIAALVRAVNRLATTFEVEPPFEFYDDADGPNARAIWPTADLPKSAVIFGRRLYGTLMQEDPSGAAVLGVLAHEYGHVALYMRPEAFKQFSSFPTAMRAELHADYLAGYYLGLRKREVPSVSLFKAGALIWNLGDTLFNDDDHHGSPVDRNRAAEAGFLLGYRVAPAFKQAFDYATNFVLVSYQHDPR
jgi:hypothetical protein